MAQAEITVAIETALNDVLRNMAQTWAKDYRVMIEVVEIDWTIAHSVGVAPDAFVESVRVTTRSLGDAR